MKRRADGHKFIFLIGYMASGKTTLGRALADDTGIGFVDLDDLVAEREGMSAAEIFATRGELSFRQSESDALRSVLTAFAGNGAIVACGGGTPCFCGNMGLMNANGLTVWLDPPTEVILRRLREDCSERPLVAALDCGEELERFVCDSMERRKHFYGQAMARFDSSRLETAAEIKDSVDEFVRRFISDCRAGSLYQDKMTYQ